MKKINLIKVSILAFASVIAISSCKKGESFYISPNSPATITPALQLAAIEVSTFNSYEGLMVKYPSILVQQNAGNDGQASPINDYILAENEFDNQWGQLYQVLYNCKDLNTKYGTTNPWYGGMADVLAAMNWGMLTDLWGDIPFSDALNGSANYQPKYDKQEDVIKGIINILDGAIVKLSKPEADNELLPANDDYAYAGDNAKWIKLAYSLKARYQNRLSNTGLYNPTDVLASLEKGISSSDEDFISIHGTASNEANQWYDFQNNRPFYILAAEPFVDSLMLRPTDERLYSYFLADDSGVVVGAPIADPTSVDASEWGSYLSAGPDKGVRLVSFTEMKFIEAEVKARQNVDASSALNDAIKESCSTVTDGAYDGADIANYTASSAKLSRVIYEKWLALFGSIEPYNDYRKTGFPNLTPNPNGQLSVIPKRFPTPQAERVSNKNAPVPASTDKVWFAL